MHIEVHHGIRPIRLITPHTGPLLPPAVSTDRPAGLKLRARLAVERGVVLRRGEAPVLVLVSKQPEIMLIHTHPLRSVEVDGLHDQTPLIRHGGACHRGDKTVGAVGEVVVQHDVDLVCGPNVGKRLVKKETSEGTVCKRPAVAGALGGPSLGHQDGPDEVAENQPLVPRHTLVLVEVNLREGNGAIQPRHMRIVTHAASRIQAVHLGGSNLVLADIPLELCRVEVTIPRKVENIHVSRPFGAVKVALRQLTRRRALSAHRLVGRDSHDLGNSDGVAQRPPTVPAAGELLFEVFDARLHGIARQVVDRVPFAREGCDVP
mmetsp:Transcript_19235/g.37449  ORF Transcript_19235/g.37449 Transcript_19235/m.37449 type:complete len:319 (-) Transcript_19235:277-1233(-)